MGKSYNTEKEWVKAKRRMPRNAVGGFIFPRVIERKPAQGDVHPIGKQRLQRLLKNIPIEYLYGLNGIELRGRTSKEIGDPFGYYSRDEKRIVLYSLPDIWETTKEPFILARGMWRHFVEVHRSDKRYIVKWADPGMMSFWFYIEVLGHELGHHYRNQYRKKRKRSLCNEELIANLHAHRFLFFLRKGRSNKPDAVS